MSEYTCEAIFENGVFKPLRPTDIAMAEGQKVRLVVETVEPAEDVLELATSVYNGLSSKQIDEIEHLILSREHFFNGRALR